MFVKFSSFPVYPQSMGFFLLPYSLTMPSLSLSGPCLMIEADIIMRASDLPEPVMAHPPQTDSDITLREWLAQVKEHNKGIKLDFKR